MSANSKIEWTDSSWNVVTGCTPIREGCRNCYAKRMAPRLKGRCGYDADDPFRVTMHPDKLDLPFEWKKPKTIFVCSMGDLFHKDVPDYFIHRIFQTMAHTPWHTYIVLTKRPERMEYLIHNWREMNNVFHADYGCVTPNVILGVSISNQKDADDLIPLLLETPAARRVVSAEPLLGDIDFSKWLFCDNCNENPDPRWGKGAIDNPLSSACGGRPWSRCFTCSENGYPKIDWVICAGESGANARPMHPDWARSIRDQCQAAGTPFFFKGWGEWITLNQYYGWNERPSHYRVHGLLKRKRLVVDKTDYYKVGKKHSGRLLDGRTWDERPKE